MTVRAGAARPRRRRTAAGAALSIVAGILLVSGPPPADAHPFGPPPTARVWAEGSRVVIDWGAAPDDAVAIGVEIGLLEPETVEAYADEPTRGAPDREVEEQLSRSDDLREYILGRIRVWQDGQRCEADLRPVDGFVTRGATTTHDCPGPVAAVEIEISMLHDIHDAYRTFAFSAGDAEPAQAVFTVASPRHRWVFGAESSDASGGVPWGYVGLIALAVVVIGGVVVAEVLSSRGDAPSDDPA